MKTTPDVAVIIPTLCRPDSLERAIASVMAQRGVEHRLKEVIIVDNDPMASARPLIEGLAATAPVPLYWHHAPQPGVATARNKGLSVTTCPLIAFLDDDEAASEQWLASLLDAHEQLKADAIFGPIRGQVPENTGWTTAYLEDFFGRQGPTDTCLIDHAYGCGNSLLVRATALPGDAPFNTQSDQTGGEDDALFAALQARGGRFGWAATAWVDEYAPPHRATLNYALTRAFAYGQGPSQTASAQGQWLSLFRWMVIGAAQTIIFGSASALMMLMRHPERARMLDRTARGLGKLFWMKNFEPKFYGSHELNRLQKQAAA